MPAAGSSPVGTYSPERRTAVVLCGTGADGAYHAGALRALHEAGVKVDIYAGCGIGAAGATLAALGGGSRLWEDDGVWLGGDARRFYRWREPVRAIGWGAVAVGLLVAMPVGVLAAGLIAIPLGFLVQMIAPEWGWAIVSEYTALTALAFAGPNLPTVIPRLVALVLVGVVVTAGATMALGRRDPERRRSARGWWWWRFLSAPLDAREVGRIFTKTIWALVRGASQDPVPSASVVGRRVSELLSENLGHPGVGELVMVAADIDARSDVVAALLREPYRAEFMAGAGRADRRSDTVDLAGAGRDHAVDVMTAALRPQPWCEPAALTFAPESYWRGETHLCADRTGIVGRLLEETSAAGASQVIVVSALAPADGPHRLRAPRLDLRGRFGQLLAAAESSALRDGLETARLRFDFIAVIAPVHNAIAAFDLAGVHDEASDRHQSVAELMAVAYQDAYRQFIEPVVGASGERLPGSRIETSADAGFDGELRPR